MSIIASTILFLSALSVETAQKKTSTCPMALLSLPVATNPCSHNPAVSPLGSFLLVMVIQ
jgi:hypothetical protein